MGVTVVPGDMMEVLARRDRGGIPECHVGITVAPVLKKKVDWQRRVSKDFVRDHMLYTALWAGRVRDCLLPGGLLAVVTTTKWWVGTMLGLDYAGLEVIDTIGWMHASEGHVGVVKWGRGEEPNLSGRLMSSWHPVVIARKELGSIWGLEEETGDGIEVDLNLKENYEEWGTGLVRHGDDVIHTPGVQTWLGGEGLKPVEFVSELMKMLCPREGMDVLDPFAGEGTVGVVAMEQEHRGWLIEQDVEKVEGIKERLGRVQK